MMDLESLPTPALLLDVERVRRNADHIRSRLSDLGARLRPHVKTHKCIEVARIQCAGNSGPVTVSTLAEAHAFAINGFSDITYAVPIETGKFKAAISLAKTCERLNLISDNPEIPPMLNAAAVRAGITIDLFVKVDCGYHRCGVEPDSPEAIKIPALISDSSNLRFAGILTHAGHSYHYRSREDRLTIARHERDVMVELVQVLRNSGIDTPTVSIGSTPTMTVVDHLAGIDEVRPGNYIFFDGFQAAIGSCRLEDCALTVLAAVVNCDLKRRKLVIDAGAIALSKDRGPISLILAVVTVRFWIWKVKTWDFVSYRSPRNMVRLRPITPILSSGYGWAPGSEYCPITPVSLPRNTLTIMSSSEASLLVAGRFKGVGNPLPITVLLLRCRWKTRYCPVVGESAPIRTFSLLLAKPGHFHGSRALYASSSVNLRLDMKTLRG